MKIKIGNERESLYTWIWNILMWMCLIAALISLLSGCQSESGRRARLAREQKEAGLYGVPPNVQRVDTVLVYVSPAKDKLYNLILNRQVDLWFVQNCHGEITLLVRQ